MATDTDYRIKLQVFEGPLDLLLFLIRKSELDIYDIPIESVTRQYIEALHTMQRLDLDVAGEFFVMAATLMEIKSRLLLPKGLHAVDPNMDEEEMDPRWELVHQLLQYKKFKEAAAELNELAVTRQNLMERFISELSLAEGERPLKGVDRIELWNAFNMILRRLAEKLVVGEIHDEQSTVADQMEWLLERTKTERSFIFTSLFPDGVTLRRLVATFLAVLELTRLKKLRVRQSEPFADILVEAVVEETVVPAILSPETAESVASTSPESAVAGAVASELPTAETTEGHAQTDPAPEAPAVSVAEDSIAPLAESPVTDSVSPVSPAAPVSSDEALPPSSTASIPEPAPTPPIVEPTPPPPQGETEIPLETPPPPRTVTE